MKLVWPGKRINFAVLWIIVNRLTCGEAKPPRIWDPNKSRPIYEDRQKYFAEI